ncbi:MAG: hypothetical protein U0232_21375 [Thermomicrobiales bacterium]
MHDYEPLDLTAWCNADATLLGTSQTPARGPQSFHGLPFQIGDPDSASNACFVAFGPNGHTGSLRIPVGRTAHRLIVAHRLLDSSLYSGAPLGAPVAEYAFLLANGERIVAPIRERFEILALPIPWGGHAFDAVNDQPNGLLPRHNGPWDMPAAARPKTQSHPRDYVLWTWTNPRLDQEIVALEIVPARTSLHRRGDHARAPGRRPVPPRRCPPGQDHPAAAGGRRAALRPDRRRRSRRRDLPLRPPRRLARSLPRRRLRRIRRGAE